MSTTTTMMETTTTTTTIDASWAIKVGSPVELWQQNQISAWPSSSARLFGSQLGAHIRAQVDADCLLEKVGSCAKCCSSFLSLHMSRRPSAATLRAVGLLACQQRLQRLCCSEVGQFKAHAGDVHLAPKRDQNRPRGADLRGRLEAANFVFLVVFSLPQAHQQNGCSWRPNWPRRWPARSVRIIIITRSGRRKAN